MLLRSMIDSIPILELLFLVVSIPYWQLGHNPSPFFVSATYQILLFSYPLLDSETSNKLLVKTT